MKESISYDSLNLKHAMHKISNKPPANIPYRAKLCRAKVTNFLKDDKILPNV